MIIPGDMGRASWVLVGQPGSMERTFGTTCHGAGRVMSRTAAVQNAQGRRIDRELAEQGVIARCRSWTGLAEEQPAAYKDVELGGRRGAPRRPGPQGRPACGRSGVVKG